MQDDRSFSPGQLFEPLTSYDMPDSLTCTREAFVASSLRRDFEKQGLGPAAAIAGGLYGLSSDHVQDLLKISSFEGSDIEKAAEAAFVALRTRQLTFGKGVWPCCEAQGRKGPRPSLILGEEGTGPSACIEQILGRLEREEQISQRKSVLSRTVSMALGRSEGKLEARKAELAEARIGGRFRVYADAILSSLHELPAILPAKAMLMDYSQELPTRIEVPLDTGKSAPQNAECYYLRYNRGKRTENALLGLIDAAEAEHLYLISVKDAVERADDLIVLDQVREELEMAGYLKGIIKKAGKRGVSKASQPAQYTLSTGHKALVGRNNIQNDELTFSIANPWDIWLHVKGAPGSHVVIRLDKGETIPPSALEEASRLAMRSSSLKAQDKADVDYTEIRKVKKVKGGLPGAVIYKDQKTITIKE
jgi:predicted ribosome quality control (RQC) complex YloA/Tae2 family protein